MVKYFTHLLKFGTRKNYRLNANLNPNWYIIFGEISNLIISENFFKEDNFALINAQSCCYQENNLVIVGDLWLTNKNKLSSQLNLKPDLVTQNDYQFILKLWKKFGFDCLNLLQGMFAFAIWDNQEKKLFLVRDSVGSRTLYYCQQNDNYYIAPRLKTLLPFHSSELNLIALRDYLSCSFIPGENTLWKDVK